MGLVHESRPELPIPSTARRLADFTGSVRSINVSRIEKIAVLAPMPSASDRIATTVTIGVALSVRKASRISGIVSSQPSFQLPAPSFQLPAPSFQLPALQLFAVRAARRTIRRAVSRIGWSLPIPHLINNHRFV